MIMTFLKIMLVAVLLVGLAWIGIAIKMFVQKDGKFTKSCGSVDPFRENAFMLLRIQ
jgi:hypothetical protein